MGYWLVVVSPEEYAAQRLYAREGLPLATGVGSDQPPAGLPVAAPGDQALVAAGDDVFAIGRVRRAGFLAYTHRMLDQPVPVGDLAERGLGVHAIDEVAFAAVAGKVGAELRVDADKRTWLVSLDLPIEASSPAEAVRAFWSYVEQLGPRELPAYVSPSNDELAMQAYVLGEVTNLDPEDDDE